MGSDEGAWRGARGCAGVRGLYPCEHLLLLQPSELGKRVSGVEPPDLESLPTSPRPMGDYIRGVASTVGVQGKHGMAAPERGWK